MPDEFLDSLDESARAEWWQRQLSDESVGWWAYVAPDVGEVSGFVTFGPARDGSADGELYALNLHPDSFGSGLADELLDVAESGLAAMGARSPYLMVVRENARARRFYERHGWFPDGHAITDDFGGTPVTELRYRQSKPPI